MIAELLKFSLVKRSEETGTLSIHRLVQAVLLDSMKADVQRQWAERVIRAVNEVFPSDASDVAAWSECLLYLDQVQACDSLIEHYTLLLFEAVDLLNRAGIYLEAHALHDVAEPLYRKDIFVETAFERRFQAMLRSAWQVTDQGRLQYDHPPGLCLVSARMHYGILIPYDIHAAVHSTG